MPKSKVEIGAINCVMKYERAQGRNPKDVSGEGIGYDIRSDNLKIEVKGRGKDKEPHVFLGKHNIEAIENSADEEYRLYVVMNPLNNPKLIIFSKDEVIGKKVKLRQWKIPLRKADFATGIPL